MHALSAHLQDVLFPVKYTDAFYDELFRDDYVVLLAFGAEQDSFVKVSLLCFAYRSLMLTVLWRE